MADMNQVIRRILLGCLMQCCTAALDGQADERSGVALGSERDVAVSLENYDSAFAEASNPGLPNTNV